MSRDIPETYPLPDADRSFVPGQYKIDAGNLDDNPPHGPADLAAAVRYLFANGKAGPIFVQLWDSDDAQTYTQAGLGDAIGSVRIPHDPAFSGLKISIDYVATVALDPGFSITCVELGESQEVTAVAAGGAVRRVTKEWTVPGMDRTYANAYHTIEVRAAGSGAAGNKLLAVQLERIPASGSIGSGVWYESFRAPDSTAYEADKPFTSDKGEDLGICITELANVRHHCFLAWMKLAGGSYPGAGKLGTFTRLIPDAEGVNTAFGWINLGGATATIAGSRLAWREAVFLAEIVDTGWKSFDLPINASEPQVQDTLSYNQITVMPESMGYLNSVSIFGL